MNQGPRRISLMEKKEGQKSRGTIPLSTAYKKKVINSCDVVYKCLTIFFLSQVKNKSHHG